MSLQPYSSVSERDTFLLFSLRLRQSWLVLFSAGVVDCGLEPRFELLLELCAGVVETLRLTFLDNSIVRSRLSASH